MLGKITEVTKGKPCSCLTGKICPACKTKKPLRVKPIVHVEGFKALPVPIKITTYKDKTNSIVLQPRRKTTTKEITPTTRSFQKIHCQSLCGKQSPTQSASQGTSLYQWYKRRKALRDLRRITKLEKEKLEELRKEQGRREREAEFLEQLVQREREIRLAKQQLAAAPNVSSLGHFECPKKVCGEETIEYKPKTKVKKAKIKATEAKLCCKTEVVGKHAKKYQQRPFSERFSNLCYRICCQFYCCVTFLMIIGLVLISVI